MCFQSACLLQFAPPIVGKSWASVFDASPAAEAGWRPGDRWVTLDAAEAPRTPADAWRRLYGRDEARFGLERDGATIHTTLRRASFFPPLF